MPFFLTVDTSLLIVEFGAGDVIVSNCVGESNEVLPMVLFGQSPVAYGVGGTVEHEPNDVLLLRFTNIESVEIVMGALQRVANTLRSAPVAALEDGAALWPDCGAEGGEVLEKGKAEDGDG